MNSPGKLTRRTLLGGVMLPIIGGVLLAGCSNSTAPAASSGGSQASAPTAASQSATSAPTTAPSSAPAPTAASSAGSAAQVTLIESSWATDTYGKFREQQRIDLFHKTYPNAKIDVNLRNVASSGYRQQVLTELAGGVGPDVFRLGWSDVFPFKEQGQIPALDDKFKSMGKDDWLGGTDVKKDIFDSATYAGKLYGIPMGGDMSCVEINKTLFKAANEKEPPLTYGSDNWSFDQMLAAAKDLTKTTSDGTPLQLGLGTDSQLNGSGNPITLVESWGGKTMSEDWTKFLWAEDPGPSAWQWNADLVWKQKVAASTAEAASGAFSYNNGKLAILPHYTSQLSYHTQDVKDKFDWDQAPWPVKGSNPVKVMFWYSAWVMNAKGKHSDEAWQLLQFVSGPIGSVPGVQLGWELPIFKSLDSQYNSELIKLGKNVKPALDGFEHRIPMMYYKQPRWQEAWTKYINPALDDIFANKKTATQALQEITPKVNALFQEGAKLMGTP